MGADTPPAECRTEGWTKGELGAGTDTRYDRQGRCRRSSWWTLWEKQLSLKNSADPLCHSPCKVGSSHIMATCRSLKEKMCGSTRLSPRGKEGVLKQLRKGTNCQGTTDTLNRIQMKTIPPDGRDQAWSEQRCPMPDKVSIFRTCKEHHVVNEKTQRAQSACDVQPQE